MLAGVLGINFSLWLEQLLQPVGLYSNPYCSREKGPFVDETVRNDVHPSTAH